MMGKFIGFHDYNGESIVEGQHIKLTIPEARWTIEKNGRSSTGVIDQFEFEGMVSMHSAGHYIIRNDEGMHLPLDFRDNQILEIIK